YNLQKISSCIFAVSTRHGNDRRPGDAIVRRAGVHLNAVLDQPDRFQRLDFAADCHQPAVVLTRERIEERRPGVGGDATRAHLRYFTNQSPARRATSSKAPGSSNK